MVCFSDETRLISWNSCFLVTSWPLQSNFCTFLWYDGFAHFLIIVAFMLTYAFTVLRSRLIFNRSLMSKWKFTGHVSPVSPLTLVADIIHWCHMLSHHAWAPLYNPSRHSAIDRQWELACKKKPPAILKFSEYNDLYFLGKLNKSKRFQCMHIWSSVDVNSFPVLLHLSFTQ